MKHLKIIIAGLIAICIVATSCSSNNINTSGAKNEIVNDLDVGTITFDIASATETEETIPEPTEPVTFKDLYGSQLSNYLDHQYYFEDKEIPMTESNFYIIDAFITLNNYASVGYYPINAEGFIDLAAEYEDSKFDTYGDYLVNYAETSLERTYILNERYKDAEIFLTEETKDAINNVVDNLNVDSVLSLEDYLVVHYGPNMTTDALKTVFEHYYIADTYAKYYVSNYEFTDDKRIVPYVRFVLFYAPSGVTDGTMDKARQDSLDFKNSCKDIEDLKTLAINNSSVYDYGDVTVSRGEMVESFENWAYDEHEVGDINIVYAPQYGYFVLGYLGTQELDEANLEYFALAELNQSVLNDINNEEYSFYTDTLYDPPMHISTPTPTPTGYPINAGDYYTE